MDYLISGLFLSICINIALSYYIRKKKNSTLTTDARLLLSELSSGKAIIKIEVIDSAGIYYRSPRG